jgi:60s Acidic ribosomal protein
MLLQLIAEGSTKLASVPSGGSGASSGGAPAATGGAPAAEEKPEEKEEEKEVRVHALLGSGLRQKIVGTNTLCYRRNPTKIWVSVFSTNFPLLVSHLTISTIVWKG